MSERAPQQNRQYEGPAELLQAGIPENNVFDRRGMPGGKSVADKLTTQYGPEGAGWGVERERYADQNQLKDELHAPEFKLATEAFNNALRNKGYKLDDGTEVTGKIQRYVRDPDTVDVVKYPDGAVYEASKKRQDGGER